MLHYIDVANNAVDFAAAASAKSVAETRRKAMLNLSRLEKRHPTIAATLELELETKAAL